MKEIARRQNESQPLKIQFASRMLFNRAENENYGIWVLCTVSALAGFVNSSIPVWIAPAIIIAADLFAYLLEKKMERDINHAADLRSMFDRYVFGMPQICSEEEADVLYELAENMAMRYPDEYTIQTTHTGNDTPPGVKNWYNTDVDIPDNASPVFPLMKENKWWDAKMVHSKNITYGAASLFVVIPAIIWGRNMQFTDMIIVAAGILGLLIRLGERLLVMWNYKKLSIQIDGFVDAFDSFSQEKGLDVIQNAIEERRHLPIVHCNALHTRLAKKLHEKYAAIHNKRIN